MPKPPSMLRPFFIRPRTPIFSQILQWPFSDQFVTRLLRDDIPQRLAFGLGHGKMWGYQDASRQVVGFGTRDYSRYTDGRPHPYIPLLAVNPQCLGKGHGTFIVEHLVGEAMQAICQSNSTFHDTLFLDVYTDNATAIGLYKKCGFQWLGDDFDAIEQKNYSIMGRRVSVDGREALPATSPGKCS